MINNWFVKMRPLLGLTGLGGGGTGINIGGGGYDDAGPLSATGGTKYTYGSKVIHAFVATGALTCNSGSCPAPTFEVFVVAGGGAGANGACGGGGGGGVRDLPGIPFAVGDSDGYTVTVGGGGYNPPGSGHNGSGGGNSSFVSVADPTNQIVATGGGYGKYEGGPSDPGGGCAGGGHGWDGPPGTAVASPDGISPTTQGADGGSGPGWSNGGGGGGGAGIVDPGPYTSTGEPGQGATGGRGGRAKNIPTTFQDPTNPYGADGPGGATEFWVAGGGGGGGWSPTGGGQAGGGCMPGGSTDPRGGAGNGNGSTGTSSPEGPGGGFPGADNTGGGGGAGSSHTPAPGGYGGSGIVFVAYPT